MFSFKNPDAPNKFYVTIFNRRYIWEDGKYVGYYRHKNNDKGLWLE